MEKLFISKIAFKLKYKTRGIQKISPQYLQKNILIEKVEAKYFTKANPMFDRSSSRPLTLFGNIVEVGKYEVKKKDTN